MTSRPLLLASLVGMTTLITACSGGFGSSTGAKKKLSNADYWQRNSASSALYMQGPKAQQMLHQDIAMCTAELKELDRLGEIRKAIPANYNSGNDMSDRTAAQQNLDTWDTPSRDGYLYNEHLEYHDFETCMYAKGWGRAEYLPYDEADKARKAYLERKYGKKRSSGAGRENVTSLTPVRQNPEPYKDLNE